MRRAVTAVVGALAAGTLLLTATPAGAARVADDPDAAKRSIDAQLEALRHDLHDTEASLATALLALKATEAKLPEARAALAKADDQAKAAEAADALAAQEVEIAAANEKKAQEELAETMAAIAKGRGRVAAFAGQVYMEQGMGTFNAAVDAANPQEIADRLSLVGAVMDTQHHALSRLATAQASQTAQEAHVEALRVDSETAKRKAEEAVKAARAAREAASAAKAELDKLAADQTAQAAAVQNELAGQKQREAEMQAESDRLTAVLRERAEAARRAAAAAAAAAGGGGGTPQGGDGYMLWPLPGGWVTSEYGSRVDPINGVGGFHPGLDIANPCGNPVIAALSGTVVSAGAAGGYGNRVVLDHGIQRGVPVATSYNHMQSIAVWGGQVSRGQVIGYEGTTGWSNGCHLHFEVFVNGGTVNPRGWL
ncbi:MAG TPA: M23 family metallopeptidase [Phycicoccus sp.]|jgi:murein DD-endopeptidase MepM/ murein hydrolase activator NlpD|nr:M23 family metallopeptidase [Phycicoccus sp.]HQH07072.1 M23 family metallopeptidase [Phycicoccus sp.]